MRKIKWGILSTARIAVEKIIPAIQKSSNGEVYAIASSSGKAETLAEKLHIPVSYNHYEELLADPNIDAVYIPLPNSMHAEWTIKAANAKKHVLCEKPAGLDPYEVEEMLGACKRNGVHFMEAFMYRFHPQHEKAKEIINSGTIGDIKMMRAFFSFYMDDRAGNIRLDSQLGGGALYDIGCYCINSLRYILDEEPIQMKLLGELNKEGVDTTAAVVLEFPSNIHASFMCSFDATFKDEYEIIGTKGSIRVPHAYRPDLNAGNGMVQLFQENEMKQYILHGDQYLLEVEHFADCVITNREPVYTGENTLNNIKVINTLLSEANKRM